MCFSTHTHMKSHPSLPLFPNSVYIRYQFRFTQEFTLMSFIIFPSSPTFYLGLFSFCLKYYLASFLCQCAGDNFIGFVWLERSLHVTFIFEIVSPPGEFYIAVITSFSSWKVAICSGFFVSHCFCWKVRCPFYSSLFEYLFLLFFF